MNVEELRNECLKKKAVTEGFPFDETTLVFKVLGKMFALVGLEDTPRLSLKCDPETALVLREQFPAVRPAYHMNKKYWNTVFLDGTVPASLLKEWIDQSYREVIKKMPLYKQKELLNE